MAAVEKKKTKDTYTHGDCKEIIKRKKKEHRE